MGIPYASAVGPDKKESVVDLAVQTLIVFLDYVVPGKGSPAPAAARGVATEQVLDSVRYACQKSPVKEPYDSRKRPPHMRVSKERY